MSQNNINENTLESLLENLPDNVKDIFSELTKEKSDEQSFDDSKDNNVKNAQMLIKIKSILDNVDNKKDDRMELIRAMSPFLRDSRKDKASKFLKAIRLSKLCQEALALINTEIGKEDS